jgi:hypothetical protein
MLNMSNVKKFIDQMTVEVGKDSLEYDLIKGYVKTSDDVKHFNKVAKTITDYYGQPLINSILYFIEDQLLKELTPDQWLAISEAASESKQGLLDLIRLNGIDDYDCYQFVQDYFNDEMIKDFVDNVFSGNVEDIRYQLVQYYNDLEQKTA